MQQLDKISSELAKLKPSLVKGDMAECARKVGTSKENVSRYMNGKVRHTDTGIKILNHFRNIIKEREKAIA